MGALGMGIRIMQPMVFLFFGVLPMKVFSPRKNKIYLAKMNIEHLPRYCEYLFRTDKKN